MEYRIDCNGITTNKDFHEKLKQVLSLPDWYGHNLDAMHDCLTEIAAPVKLTLDNFSALKAALGEYAGKVMFVLHICAEENPNLEISLEN